jgi:hypothetical protein
MKQEIQRYIPTCPTYAANKHKRKKPSGLLTPIVNPPIPYKNNFLDLMNGFSSELDIGTILVFTGAFTKKSIITALKETHQLWKFSGIWKNDSLWWTAIPEV